MCACVCVCACVRACVRVRVCTCRCVHVNNCCFQMDISKFSTCTNLQLELNSTIDGEILPREQTY